MAQTYSALVGAIWQVNDKLSFDVAVRQNRGVPADGVLRRQGAFALST
jgi:hypothetical protein